MKKAFVAVAASLLLATVASAQYTLELDLDGVTGNGPDYVNVVVSDYVDVNVWLFGEAGLFSWGADIANLDGSLEFQGAVYNTPAGWTNAPPVVSPDGTVVTIQATDFNFTTPLVLPAMVATLTYHAAVDASCDDITVPQSGYLNTLFGSGIFDPAIGATVEIGDCTPPNASQETSWGAVKDLFR